MRRPPLLRLLRLVVRRPHRAASYPPEPADYLLPDLDGGPGPSVDGIPVAHTRSNAHGWAPAVLADCRDPLSEGAPDLRGVWVVEHGRMRGMVQRIEQAGDRVVITVGWLVHDMRADGTLEGGVHDVDPNSGEVHVAAEFTDDRLDLRPNGGRVLVSRRLDPADAEVMHWRYGPFSNRCRRLAGPPDGAGST
ncbi:MAG: hypothetical protein P6D49_00985 [Acidimicrobiales bacterium]|nr:hypothetical protein [Acidimicrobiales bacterium]